MLVYAFLDNVATLRVLLSFCFDLLLKFFVELFDFLIDFVNLLLELIVVEIKL